MTRRAGLSLHRIALGFGRGGSALYVLARLRGKVFVLLLRADPADTQCEAGRSRFAVVGFLLTWCLALADTAAFGLAFDRCAGIGWEGPTGLT